MKEQKTFPIELRIKLTKNQYDRVNEMIEFLGFKSFFELTKKALSYYYIINTTIYNGRNFYFDNNQQDKFTNKNPDKLWKSKDEKIHEFKVSFNPDQKQMLKINFLLNLKKLDLSGLMFETLILLDYLIDQNKQGKNNLNYIDNNQVFQLDLPNKKSILEK